MDNVGKIENIVMFCGFAERGEELNAVIRAKTLPPDRCDGKKRCTVFCDEKAVPFRRNVDQRHGNLQVKRASNAGDESACLVDGGDVQTGNGIEIDRRRISIEEKADTIPGEKVVVSASFLFINGGGHPENSCSGGNDHFTISGENTNALIGVTEINIKTHNMLPD